MSGLAGSQHERVLATRDMRYSAAISSRLFQRIRRVEDVVGLFHVAGSNANGTSPFSFVSEMREAKASFNGLRDSFSGQATSLENLWRAENETRASFREMNGHVHDMGERCDGSSPQHVSGRSMAQWRLL